MESGQPIQSSSQNRTQQIVTTTPTYNNYFNLEDAVSMDEQALNQVTESSDDYIDDYYASSMINNRPNMRRNLNSNTVSVTGNEKIHSESQDQQIQFLDEQQQNSNQGGRQWQQTQLETIKEQPTNSVAPSSISSSCDGFYVNASVNIALVGTNNYSQQSAAQHQQQSQSIISQHNDMAAQSISSAPSPSNKANVFPSNKKGGDPPTVNNSTTSQQSSLSFGGCNPIQFQQQNNNMNVAANTADIINYSSGKKQQQYHTISSSQQSSNQKDKLVNNNGYLQQQQQQIYQYQGASAEESVSLFQQMVHQQRSLNSQVICVGGGTTSVDRSCDAMGSGLLAQPGAAAVPLFYNHHNGNNNNNMSISQSQQSSISVSQSQTEQLTPCKTAPVLPGLPHQNQQMHQTLQKSSSTKQHQQQQQPRRKRKMNDDYGIYYQYTCESDSSQQTTPNQQQQQQQQLGAATSSQQLLSSPLQQTSIEGASSEKDNITPGSIALQQTGFSSLAALRQAAAQARSSASAASAQKAHQKKEIQSIQNIDATPPMIMEQMNIIESASNNKFNNRIDLQSPSRQQNQGNPHHLHQNISEQHLQQIQINTAVNNPYPPTAAQGRNVNRQQNMDKILSSPDKGSSNMNNMFLQQANTLIMPPKNTLSSGRKLAEDKSFRHDFYSIDAAEAHDQFGANPISLGMDGDYGQTLTQTGLEALIEDDLIMDMVMSRVDWIIKLRDVHYRLLDQTQHRQQGKIRADKLMKHLISLQDSLKLMPIDEYSLSNQRHEVCISYRTILENLRQRILDHSKKDTTAQQLYGKTNTSIYSNTYEASLFNSDLMLQLDEIIDLPFKRTGIGNYTTHPNTQVRPFEDEKEPLMMFERQDQEFMGNMKVNDLDQQRAVTTQSPHALNEAVRRSSISPLAHQIISKVGNKSAQSTSSLEVRNPITKGSFTPQIYPGQDKNVVKKNNGENGGAKLSSISSKLSSSEPDLLSNSFDESRQLVYGTKKRRGSSKVAARSKSRGHSARSKNASKSTPRQCQTNANNMKETQKNTRQKSSRPSKDLMKQKPTSQSEIRQSISITNLVHNSAPQRQVKLVQKRNTSSYNTEIVSVKQSKIGHKNSQTLSDRTLTDPDTNKTGTIIVNSISPDAIYPPQSITPGDSIAQVTSIDAYKYQTQKPPLTMVTKTLQHNRHQNMRPVTNIEEPSRNSVNLRAFSQPHTDLIESVPDLEETRQMIYIFPENDEFNAIDSPGRPNQSRKQSSNYHKHKHGQPSDPIPMDQRVDSIYNQHSLSESKSKTQLHVLRLQTPDRFNNPDIQVKNIHKYSASESKEYLLTQTDFASNSDQIRNQQSHYQEESTIVATAFNQKALKKDPSAGQQRFHLNRISNYRKHDNDFSSQDHPIEDIAGVASETQRYRVHIPYPSKKNVKQSRRREEDVHQASPTPPIFAVNPPINVEHESSQENELEIQFPAPISFQQQKELLSRAAHNSVQQRRLSSVEIDEKDVNNQIIETTEPIFEKQLNRDSSAEDDRVLLFQEKQVIKNVSKFKTNNSKGRQKLHHGDRLHQSPPIKMESKKTPVSLGWLIRGQLGGSKALSSKETLHSDNQLHQNNHMIQQDMLSGKQHQSSIKTDNSVMISVKNNKNKNFNATNPSRCSKKLNIQNYIDDDNSSNANKGTGRKNQLHHLQNQSINQEKGAITFNNSSNVKAQTNVGKIPPQQTQSSRSKKKLLRLVSPKNQDPSSVKLQQKDFTSSYSTTKNSNVKSHFLLGGSNTPTNQNREKQTMSGSSSQHQALQKTDKRVIKMKKTTLTNILGNNKSKTKMTIGLGGTFKESTSKTASVTSVIKQIQMVHLNPSQGSSLSPSRASTNSVQSFSQGYPTGIQSQRTGIINNIVELKQAYSHYENGGEHRRFSHNIKNSVGDQQTTHRKKSMSNLQTQKRARMLSPAAASMVKMSFVTPRFDSYETLPPSSKNYVQKQQRNLRGKVKSNFGTESAPAVSNSSQKGADSEAQSSLSKKQYRLNNVANQQNNKMPPQYHSNSKYATTSSAQLQSHHRIKHVTSSGVSHGLSSINSNALKLNFPPQVSPTKRVGSAAGKLGFSSKDTKRKSITPLAKGNIYQQSNNVLQRVKFKGLQKANDYARTKTVNNNNYNTDSFVIAQPQNSSAEVEMTSSSHQQPKGKITKIKVFPKSKKKPQTNIITRQTSHEGAGSSVTNSSINVPVDKRYSEGTQASDFANQKNNNNNHVFELQLKNMKTHSQHSKTATLHHQLPRSSHHHQSSSSVRKTSQKQYQQPVTCGTQQVTMFQQREKSNSTSAYKSNTIIKGGMVVTNQQQQHAQQQQLQTQQSHKQMTITQNTSTLLQNLQLKNKKSILNMKNNNSSQHQTRILRFMANLNSKEKQQKQQNHHQFNSAAPRSTKEYNYRTGGKTAGGTQTNSSPVDITIPRQNKTTKSSMIKTSGVATAAASSSTKSFRLFTSAPVGVVQEALTRLGSTSGYHQQQQMIRVGSVDDDDNCEAMMVACENLPCEPLMPRSHKSSARSFLKNVGQFGQEKNSKSFLQNVSQTSKHTNSTGLNNSSLMNNMQPGSLTAPASKTRLPLASGLLPH